MAAAAAIATSTDAAPAKGKGGGKKKLIMLAAPVLLLAILAGLWFTGVLPGLLGMSHEPEHAKADSRDGAGGTVPHPPVFADLPEMITNLNAPGRHATFVKLKARVELSRSEDQAAFTAALPRVVDLFQTYLREVRPEELRGSAGTYRLREELITRANIAVAPAHVVDVLFSELLVQ